MNKTQQKTLVQIIKTFFYNKMNLKNWLALLICPVSFYYLKFVEKLILQFIEMQKSRSIWTEARWEISTKF